MIKQKFLQVLFWIKDHFRFLVEVVIRLSLGIVEKENPQKQNHTCNSMEKGDSHDK